MTNSFVQIETFRSARKLLDSLSPRQDRWAMGGNGNDDPSHWIFRGQRDEWPLIPSAGRDKAWEKFGWVVASDNESRLRQELGAVWSFASEADRPSSENVEKG